MHMGELAPASCVGRNGRTDKVYSLSCLVRIIPFGSGFPARVLIELDCDSIRSVYLGPANLAWPPSRLT